jgi:protein subunit release factor A
MSQKTQQAKARAKELTRLREDISAIQRDLESAYMSFDRETDPAMTEAYIYEISALRARYDHAFHDLKNFFS